MNAESQAEYARSYAELRKLETERCIEVLREIADEHESAGSRTKAKAVRDAARELEVGRRPRR